MREYSNVPWVTDRLSISLKVRWSGFTAYKGFYPGQGRVKEHHVVGVLGHHSSEILLGATVRVIHDLRGGGLRLDGDAVTSTRQQMIAALFNIENPIESEIRARLDRLNIGVVVTEAEHARLPKHGNESDPWSRYLTAEVEWKDQRDA